jgi:riboflavin kinase/FMN adenylyltransferase
MNIYRDKTVAATRHSVCAIGSFDGVHLGHRAIIRRAREIAGASSATGVITFLPLPFFVLKGLSPMYLTVKAEKEKILSSLGVDFIFYYTFNSDLASLEPGAFIDRMVETINPAHVVVGPNFHFGSARAGSARNLARLAKNAFAVHITEPVEHDGIISSTRIRELLLLGNVGAANELLGREYSVTGQVIKGRGKGSILGFPTVNIHAPSDKLMPLDGIYAAHVKVNEEQYNGALFLRHDLIEVYLLDYDDEVYGQEIAIHFVKRIRNIESFPDDAALINAIAEDVATIRTFFSRGHDDQ